MSCKEISQEKLLEYIKSFSDDSYNKKIFKHYSTEAFVFLMSVYWGHIHVLKAFEKNGFLDNDFNKDICCKCAYWVAGVSRNIETQKYIADIGLMQTIHSFHESRDRISVEMGFVSVAKYIDDIIEMWDNYYSETIK